MVSTMGLERTHFVNPDLYWKRVSRTTRTRTKRSRNIIWPDKITRRFGISVSESEKLGASLLGSRFIDKVAHVPIKKRRFTIRSPSPSPPHNPSPRLKPSEQKYKWFCQNSNRMQQISTVDEERSEITHENLDFPEDFSGMAILADAACDSSMIDDMASNVLECQTVDGISTPEGIDSVNHSKGITSSTEEPSFSLKNVENDGDSLTTSPKLETTKKSVSSQNDRSHWDLNTVMTAWEQPFDDSEPIQDSKYGFESNKELSVAGEEDNNLEKRKVSLGDPRNENASEIEIDYDFEDGELRESLVSYEEAEKRRGVEKERSCFDGDLIIMEKCMIEASCKPCLDVESRKEGSVIASTMQSRSNSTRKLDSVLVGIDSKFEKGLSGGCDDAMMEESVRYGGGYALMRPHYMISNPIDDGVDGFPVKDFSSRVVGSRPMTRSRNDERETGFDRGRERVRGSRHTFVRSSRSQDCGDPGSQWTEPSPSYRGLKRQTSPRYHNPYNPNRTPPNTKFTTPDRARIRQRSPVDDDISDINWGIQSNLDRRYPQGFITRGQRDLDGDSIECTIRTPQRLPRRDRSYSPNFTRNPFPRHRRKSRSRSRSRSNSPIVHLFPRGRNPGLPYQEGFMSPSPPSVYMRWTDGRSRPTGHIRERRFPMRTFERDHRFESTRSQGLFMRPRRFEESDDEYQARNYRRFRHDEEAFVENNMLKPRRMKEESSMSLRYNRESVYNSTRKSFGIRECEVDESPRRGRV